MRLAKFAVILAAAGRSSRFKNKHYKKPFAPLANRAVWLYSADRFLNRSDVVQVILVIAPEDRADFNLKFAATFTIIIGHSDSMIGLTEYPIEAAHSRHQK